MKKIKNFKDYFVIEGRIFNKKVPKPKKDDEFALDILGYLTKKDNLDIIQKDDFFKIAISNDEKNEVDPLGEENWSDDGFFVVVQEEVIVSDNGYDFEGPDYHLYVVPMNGEESEKLKVSQKIIEDIYIFLHNKYYGKQRQLRDQKLGKLHTYLKK